ncbi:glycosyl hydrolase [Pterulicium gracile]|uniref:Glycosyl hydrolase n=1 Tax=Pterulicium gracile TaxID=1884261 RepID=A0A5C3QPV1_9AGAR|nr:glycosyl hydrolase [Pterula gracilis]
MFLVDPLTTPKPWWSNRSIQMTKFLKRYAPGGAFDFFTYEELLWWFFFCVAINPFRWKWAPFVFFGIGKGLPMKIVHHEGYYYLTPTTWNNVQITRATTINGLKTAAPKTDRTDSTASRCCNLWAPGIHWIPAQGSWYIYYSAGSSGTFDNQRSHVLKGSSTNIWNSSWSYSGRLVIPNRDVWAIDDTVLVIGNDRYFVFSSWDGPVTDTKNPRLMTSATTLGNATKISAPTLSWERVGANVNEGAAPIYHGGNTWIVYSASNCAATGYKLGSLQWTGGNPLSASSWQKNPNPIFQYANGNHQPGHSAFFLSPSGNQIWNNTPGACDGSRCTAVQQVNFNSNGELNLGAPIARGQEIAEPV